MKHEKLNKQFWSHSLLVPKIFRKLLVRYRYKKLMRMLLKSYMENCNEIAWLQEKAPKSLIMKWAFQQRRIMIYDRYLSI